MPEPKFKWNNRAGRYTNASGKFISQARVNEAFSAAIDNSAKVMASHTQALKEGRTTLRAWQVTMRAEVKNVHLYTGALSKGGFAQLSPADLGRIGQRVKEQYKYLDRFAQQIAQGAQVTDGTIIGRSRLYAQSGRQTLHLMDRANNEARGLTEERCLAESKPCPGCANEASRGWVPIGSLVPIGSRQCNMNCRCEVEYR
jgi:hypothetical protein